MGVNLNGLQGKGPNGDINVTPLIDVVLVLLIIFMVLTPIIIEEMAVNLPQDTNTPPPEDKPEKQLLAAACEDGRFALNRQIFTLGEMGDELRRELKRKKSGKRVVFVDGHPDAAYEDVVRLMDTVRDAGAEKVGVAKLKASEDFKACEAKTPAAPSTPASP